MDKIIRKQEQYEQRKDIQLQKEREKNFKKSIKDIFTERKNERLL